MTADRVRLYYIVYNIIGREGRGPQEHSTSNSFGRHLDPPFHGSSPCPGCGTTAYIQAHLEHTFLVELAAVTADKPAHFAHLFKQATGQTPPPVRHPVPDGAYGAC